MISGRIPSVHIGIIPNIGSLDNEITHLNLVIIDTLNTCHMFNLGFIFWRLPIQKANEGIRRLTAKAAISGNVVGKDFSKALGQFPWIIFCQRP